jgi:cytochrome c-type biogenesis protein CcmH
MSATVVARTLLVALALLLGSHARAIEPLPYRDAAEESRFRALTAELRCVMCQNQSLADSNAGIAQDLRREIFELMREGRSDEEIKQFLTERYGEFVLYDPPVAPRTWLLWFGPALVLLAGAVTVVVVVRRKSASAGARPAPEEDW